MRTIFWAVSVFVYGISASALAPNGNIDNGNIEMSSKGVVGSVLLPVSEVKKLIPENFELVPIIPQMSDVHPVRFFIGEQKNITETTGEVRTEIARSYSEVSYTIPNVKRAGREGLFTYIPSSLVSDQVAKAIGDRYGYQKHLARFETKAHSVVAFIGEEEVLSVTVDTPSVVSEAALKANIAFVAALPQTQIVVRASGDYQCVKTETNFAQAHIRPVRLTGNFGYGFPGIIAKDFLTRGLDKTPLGSYSVDAQTKLNGPIPCW